MTLPERNEVAPPTYEESLKHFLDHYKVQRVSDLARHKEDKRFWQDRLWENWGTKCSKWIGEWVTYHPKTCDVVDRYRFERSFWTEKEHPDTIFHTKTFWFTDGRGTVSANYNVSKDEIMRPYGMVVNCEDPHLRATLFPTGNATYLHTNISFGKPVGGEIVMPGKHTKLALYVTFQTKTEGKGFVSKIMLVREDTRGWPSPYWSADLTDEQLQMRSLTPHQAVERVGGSFTGFKATMQLDLSVNIEEKIPFNVDFEGSDEIFELPDDCIFHVRRLPEAGKGLEFRAFWLRDGYIEETGAFYDGKANESVVFAAKYWKTA
ncbi:hypothetical protein HDU85_005847 [Gaertneriomyces sp. JEL0708]|nr:hypothetical protein HDU85_005847 [Gaertneriomyces sp. JEL0708]